MKAEGIEILPVSALSDEERSTMREYYEHEIFPVLTPLAFDKSHPFPFISNLSLNLAIVIRDPQKKEELFARIKVPTDLFPRLIRIPAQKIPKKRVNRRKNMFSWKTSLHPVLTAFFPVWKLLRPIHSGSPATQTLR